MAGVGVSRPARRRDLKTRASSNWMRVNSTEEEDEEDMENNGAENKERQADKSRTDYRFNR